MFLQGLKKYPESTALRLGYAFFQMEFLQQQNSALEEFTKALSTGPSFGE